MSNIATKPINATTNTEVSMGIKEEVGTKQITETDIVTLCNLVAAFATAVHLMRLWGCAEEAEYFEGDKVKLIGVIHRINQG